MDARSMRRTVPVVWGLAVAALMLAGGSPAYAQTSSTWNGAAGDGEYATPGNWLPVGVPLDDGDTYLVTIPAGAVVSYDFPVPTVGQITALTLDGTLVIDPDEDLTVVGDADVAGRLEANAGSFTAASLGSQFVGNKATVAVTAGGTIHLAATSYSAAGLTSSATLMSATGSSSLLDLSSLVTLADEYQAYNGVQVHTVTATNDGVIDLSGLEHVTGPALETQDRLDFVLSSGGDILLDSLQSTAATGRVRFSVGIPAYALPALLTAGSTQFDVSASAVVDLPVLQSHNGGAYNLAENATVNAGALESLTNASISLGDGAVLNAPNLVNLSGTVVALSPGRTFTTAALSDLDNARIAVSGGLTFGTAYGDVSATSYSSADITSSATLFSAAGTGSVLDLASIASLSDAFRVYNGVQVHTISATEGGVVDLSGLESVVGPNLETQDRLDFVLASGGSIPLNSLQSTAATGRVRFAVGVAAYALPALATAGSTQFDVDPASVLTLASLTTHNGGGYALGSGAEVHAPVLAALNNATVTLQGGAVFDAPNLANFAGSTVALSLGRTFTTAALSDLDNARIAVSGGLVFGTAYGDVSATSYSSADITWTDTLFSAAGAGSVLDLASITHLSDAFRAYNGVQVHTISATEGGVVDLSGLESVVGPNLETQDRLDFVLASGGSIPLNSLQSTAGTGRIRFAVGVAAYALPALLTAGSTQFDVSASAVVDLPALQSHDGGAYNLAENAVVNAGALESLNNASISLADGAVLNAPNLADFGSSTVALSPGRTFTTAALSDLDNARIAVSGGLAFGTAYGDVSATSYSSAGVTWTDTLFSAAGAGSVLDLASIASLSDAFRVYGGVQVHTISATESGLVDLSGLESIVGPNLEAQDRLDFVATGGGRIDLSSLQSVSGVGQVRFMVSAGGQLTLGEVTVSDEMTLSLADDTSATRFLGTLYLDPTSRLSVSGGAKVQVGGNFSFDYTDETRFACDTALFQFNGTGEQWMEVGGQDLGLGGPLAGNFGFTQLIVGTETQATTVVLVDLVDNGNRGSNEALYLFGSGGLDGLRIPGPSTLLIGDINVYALIDGEMVHLNALFGPGINRIPYEEGFVVLPEPATLALLALGGLAFVWRRRRA